MKRSTNKNILNRFTKHSLSHQRHTFSLHNLNKSHNVSDQSKTDKLTFVWIFVGLFIISTVYLTIQSSTAGAKLSYLEKERVELSKSNEELASLLMQKTSLTKIEEKKDELGFARSNERVYIKAQESFADVKSSY